MKENKDYLSKQILTYMGNKRSLLDEIEQEIVEIKEDLGRKLKTFDVFSGSGIVSRMMKKHSKHVISNDLEKYSFIINNAYLTNKSDFNNLEFESYLSKINNIIEEENFVEGIISKEYSPSNDKDIKIGERVFYTNKNARIIDTIRSAIEDFPDEIKNFFLAQLLIESSIHVNTAGIFKGFYKDSSTGIGKFGGNGENALLRIKGDISFDYPILSNFESKFTVYQEDSNELAKKLKDIDVAYIDPPYNQHPYGSNYFMLNIIANNKISNDLSPVSGIPKDWNRSNYNKKKEIYDTFDDLIGNLDARNIIVSYNSEGFLTLEEIKTILKKYGKVKIKEIKYNSFRGGRNLRERDIHVHEYIFVLNKR